MFKFNFGRKAETPVQYTFENFLIDSNMSSGDQETKNLHI